MGLCAGAVLAPFFGTTEQVLAAVAVAVNADGKDHFAYEAEITARPRLEAVRDAFWLSFLYSRAPMKV
jgi:hypothetical protein